MERNTKNSNELSKESEIELNLKQKRNAIQEQTNSCLKRSNKCKNKELIKKCILRLEFNDIEVETTEDELKNAFHSSNDSIDLKAKHKLLNYRERDLIEESFSPIEEFRADPVRHRQRFHTYTSMPEPKGTTFDIEVDTTEDELKSVFQLSNDSMDLKAKHKLSDNREDDSIEEKFSPIEEFRTDQVRHWQQFHTTTSTPTANEVHTMPELNISNISLESSDSDMAFERQISRFQITDEILHSISIDSIAFGEVDNSRDTQT